jgi:ABC-type phosphate transport system substrate-binding protein
MQRGNTMRCDFSMGNTSMKFIAGAVLLCLASAASAGTLVGGGATLPAIGYTGSPTGSPITPGTGSLFGVYSSPTGGAGSPVTYCPTGSGAGKKILAGNDALNFQVNGTCGGTAPSGFGGVGLSQAAFAGSDAPLAVSEFTNYVTGHGAGTQPVQLPSIAGAISIVFHKDANAATGAPAVTSMTLTEGQICGIFSGQITDWSTLAAAGTVPSTVSGPIKVVFRGDGSGTSFSFLNHLSAVCPSNTAGTLPAAVSFKTNQSFAAGTTAYTYVGAISATGNAGVTTAVNGADGSIGYAEAANGVTAPARFASVKNSHSLAAVNPSTGFGPTAVPVNLVFDQAIADAVDANGRPTLTPLTTPAAGCIAVVNPSDYADPSTGYPILAVTYLIGNAQGNGTDAAAVRGLLFSPYNKTTRPSVTKIGRITTGYAWLSNAATLDSTDPVTGVQAKINACVN